MTTSVKCDTRRQPDYYIGPNGIPRLTVAATGSRMRKMNSPQPSLLQHQPTDPVKLNKCLYNLTVRNGTGSNTGTAGRSDKIESDIAIRNQYSSKSSSSNCSRSSSSSLSPSPALNSLRRSSPTTTVASLQVANRNDPRNTSQQQSHNSSPSIPRISTSSRNNNGSSSSSSSMNGSRTLLSGRQQRHRSAAAAGDDAGNVGDAADANLIINGSSSNGDRRRSSGVVVRQYRLSAAIDNRLSYQRKYDRTIFGCNRLDQFVLPPLQI